MCYVFIVFTDPLRIVWLLWFNMYFNYSIRYSVQVTEVSFVVRRDVG